MATQIEEPHTQANQPVGTAGAGQAHSLRRRAVRGGTILITTRLLLQIFTWAVTLLVARFLLPRDYGIMTAGLIFVGLADILAEAGVGRALVQKERLEPDDLAEAFTLTALLSAALYFVLFWLAGPAAEWLETPELTGFLRVLALLLLLGPLRSIPLALLDRHLLLGKQSAVHVMSALVQAALVLGLALAGYGYWALAWGIMGARLLETGLLVCLSGWVPSWRLPGMRARGLLAFGIHVSLASLFWFVYSNADHAIVGKLAGPVTLGFYALAFQLMSLPVQKLTANVNQVAYPVYCRLQNDRARLRGWYLRLTVLLGFVGIPALIGLALVAEEAFVVVLGERWQPAVLPFQLLSVVGVLRIISTTLPPLLNALGRPDLPLKYTLVCTLVYPAAFVAGGLAGEMIGICVVWLILYPIMVTMLVLYTRGLTGVGPLSLLRVQAPVLAAVALMAVAVLITRWSTFETPMGLRLAISIAVGAVVYASAIWLVGRRSVIADVGVLWRDLRAG